MNETERTFEVLKKLSNKDEICDSDRLQEELMLDSLLLVTLLVELEEEFDIVFKECDMNPFDLKTVGNVIDLVQKYRNGEEKE